MMKRVKKELKQRTKVVGVFLNEESLIQLVGFILMGVNEERVTGRKYLTIEKECFGKETGLRQITENLRRHFPF